LNAVAQKVEIMKRQGHHTSRRLGAALLGAAGLAALSYVGYASMTWARYGRRPRRRPADPVLDRFLPDAEVVERHELRVRAPADVAFLAARDLDLTGSAIVKAIFAGRSLFMGASAVQDKSPAPLIEKALWLGWGILVEIPGRKVVFGAVAKPWNPDVVFEAVPADGFATFDRPGYAKIVWTLEAEPLGPASAIVRTETRVSTTDRISRERFRRYWAAVSPGVRLIRRQMLRVLRARAERMYHAGRVHQD
jgi:hypothetical protein